MLRGKPNKVNLLKILLNQDNGDYFDKSGNIKEGTGLEYIKTKCFRLIPKRNLNDNPNDEIIEQEFPHAYSNDGERYKIEPIQVKMLNKKLQIFCY